MRPFLAFLYLFPDKESSALLCIFESLLSEHPAKVYAERLDALSLCPRVALNFFCCPVTDYLRGGSRSVLAEHVCVRRGDLSDTLRGVPRPPLRLRCSK